MQIVSIKIFGLLTRIFSLFSLIRVKNFDNVNVILSADMIR